MGPISPQTDDLSRYRPSVKASNLDGMSVPSHVIPLRLVQAVSADVGRAAVLLGGDASTWLGSPVPAARPNSRRYLTDLSLPLREHAPSFTFKKAAFVDIGEVRPTAEGCEVEIGWQSSSLAPLFPVFAGRLAVSATRLTLEGFYAPPGGEIGVVLDRAFLNIAARGTARWFLARAAEVLASRAIVADSATAQPLAPNPAAGPRAGRANEQRA
jgi:hypothetical protein